MLGDFGEPVRVERKHHTKLIRISRLDSNTNVSMLAEQIVEKENLIHYSKLPLVENLVYALQQRVVNHVFAEKSNLSVGHK